MKVSEYIIRFLEKKHTKDIFYLPGGGCMHLLDSMFQSKQLKGTCLLHEQAVAIAAESYAFTSGKTGVVLVTTGPGGTNTVTGVLAAYLDSIPCLYLSGQVKTTDLKSRFHVRCNGLQEADITNIVKDITKYSVTVTDKNTIRYHLEKAWYLASAGRKGPVWLDIPLDVQGADINPGELTGFSEPLKVTSNINDEISKLIQLLKTSKRPVLLAGNGLRGSEKAFYTLIEKLNIPIIPTWKAIDLIPNAHPLYAGKCGSMGERAANFAMQTADLILSFGCRLDFSITGFDRSKWAPTAKKVVVDLDEAELYKLQIKIDLPIIGDVKDVMEALVNQLDILPDYSSWRSKIKHWQIKYSIWNEKREPLQDKINFYDFMKILCLHACEEMVFVPSSAGTVAEIFHQSMEVKKGQIIRSNHGLGAMGFDLPAAIGAYIASNKTVICICGDGGMQLNIQELAVIAEKNFPIKIFVINNGGYSSIRNMQNNHFKGRYIGNDKDSGLYLPDLTALAKAYGIPAITISKTEELSTGITQTLNSQGAFLCNVSTEHSCVLPRSASKVLPNGQMVSTPLEDLYPFLDEEELKNELRI